ncbi:gephyrin-like molybdotransferase receptor GlpR [Streptomyces sp. NPDC004528]|uniref:divisome protein SepX/GlpR n=1 Tax=Streptomyces sp. NPDC004528 TaxID=3154550 RepID=UPI0033B3FB26
MSSSGLIYAVIVGAWAAYLVPMWLRRQDELNEARPTERFSTAIRLLSGRAGMERRYAKDLRARSTEEGEPSADPGGATDSVDVRAFAMPPAREHTKAQLPQSADPEPRQAPQPGARHNAPQGSAATARPVPPQPAHDEHPAASGAPAASRLPAERRVSAAEAAARARRTKVLARRRRTTVLIFLAFTCGAIVAAVGGLAFLWAPGVPAVMLSAYIVYLRAQERRRFTYVMDRRRAEAAAQRLRERQPRRRAAGLDQNAEDQEEGPEPETDTGISTLAADRRALVEQTDHAEWVDQQRERRQGPGRGDSWDPVPVPLPTYVTAPVAPRATSSVDLGAPDTWSSARSSAVEPAEPEAEPADEGHPAEAADEAGAECDGRSDARRAASARRARERGRTPLFDQYEDGERPRAANE